MERPFSFRSGGEMGEMAGEMIHGGEGLYENREAQEEMVKIILFRLSGEWYGVEIANVKEVIKVGPIAYLPSSPEYIAGIINLRGNILSVIDLKAILGLPYEEQSDKARIIAIEAGGMNAGFLVSEVVKSLEIPKTKITSTLLTIPPEGAKYIKGQCNIDGRLIAILHVERILEMRA